MPAILMPQPGQSVTEGTVLKWLKQPGDPVKIDEILVEIETEKVNVELPSPYDGVLMEILVPEGETVPVGAELAVIEETGAAAGAAVRTPDAAEMEQAAEGVEMTDGEQPAASPAAAAGVLVPPAPPASAATPERAPPPRQNGGANAARYSPAVLTLAAEHKLDLAQIGGSGMGGRITRKDVIQFLEGRDTETTPPAVSPVPPSTAVQQGDRGPAAPTADAGSLAAARSASVPPAAPAPSATSRSEPAPLAAAEDEEIIKPSATRLTIARNMMRSALSVPVAWMVVETDVTGLVQLRERHKEAFRQCEGVDLTYLPFVIEVVTAALKGHPMLNSEWRDEQIVLKQRVNIGVAVGVEEGLIVPVIQNADRLSLSGLAHALADLAARARTRKLRIEDVTGGTFTLDNTGVFGSLVSQPIINPPQAAILSTEAIIKRPVVRDDAIAIRSIMNLCISFDHRIVDGTQVGPFMQAVKRGLEGIGPDRAIG